MTNLFYRFYVFTSRHRRLSTVLFLFVFLTSLFVGANIRLEENIINLIPKSAEISKINSVLEGFRMNGRLIMHVYHEDSSAHSAQQLIAVSHQVSDSLQEQYGAYISGIQLEYNDSSIQVLYEYFAENLPFYFQPEDYAAIEPRLTKEGIDATMLKNYKTLVSPISIVSKDMLMKDPLSLVGLPLQRTQKLQLDDNIQLYQNHLISKDRKHMLFFINLAQPPNETASNGKLVAGIDDLIENFKVSNPHVHIEYFGPAAVAVANAQRIKQDIIVTVSLAMAALFVFIYFFYRSLSVFFMAVTPGLFGAALAIASLSVLRDSVSVISLGVGAVLLGITIDYALHFITHYKDEKDVEALFKDLTVPLLMSSVTTACAFFSLVFLRTSALADLGIFAGVSVIAASLYTLTVLPHWVLNKKDSIKRRSGKNSVEKAVTFLATYPFHKAKWSIVSCILLTVVSLFTWKNYQFESNMLRLNYMPDRLATFENNLNKISTYSANSVFLISEGAEFWEALEAERLVKQELEVLQEQGLIINYFSLSDLIPPLSVQQQRLATWEGFWDAPKTDTVVSRINRSAEALGFRANGFDALEAFLTQEHALLKDEDVAHVLSVIGEDFIIRSGEGVSIVSSVKTTQENKEQVLEALSAMEEPLVFDKGFLASQLVNLLQEDFNKLVNLSLIVVFFIILISYGRLELAIITFTPILLSWLWILGLMGLFDLRFNIINVIICTFIFGLGVDYSIFGVRGLTQRYSVGKETITSYRKSVILSAVTTLLSIGVLAFAEHPALRSIAFLAIIGILATIFITFTVQPILYYLFILKRKQKGVLPYTLSTLFLSVFAFVYFLFGCLLLTVIRVVFYLPLFSEKRKKSAFHWILMCFCRSLVYIMANLKKEVRGKENADFSKPSVIISNHHSFLDIVILLMFHPKVVMLTNDWVYNSPFFGTAVQYADFIPTAKGVEEQLAKIRALVKDGYSIIVFPEGTRSPDFKIGRFHKGAFYLASELNLDIQPVVLHGTNYIMPLKDPFHVKSGKATIWFLPRISASDAHFGSNYSERTKAISRYFKKEYESLRNEIETPAFFRETLVKNYIYKGPVLEWYLRIKFKLENSYALFHSLIPKDAKVLDLGCGYGFLGYSLAFSGEKRDVTGVDYDRQKIAIAKNCPVKPGNLRFHCEDITAYSLPEADVFIVSDVLHYLVEEEQDLLLNRIAGLLNFGGKIIIRDGDSSKKERHAGTILTEIFSTNSGFNKTKNKLCFISEGKIAAFAKSNQFDMEVIDHSKHTSNTVYVLQRKNQDGQV